MADRVTAAKIQKAMANRWTAPEWAIMWEVADATGAHGRRYADAVMMSLWPSRGLELHGVEIKVSRADWKREAADPAKAEAVGQYCDRWWVHTPPGIVDDISDIPPFWGLREFDGKRWHTIKDAEKGEAKPVSRGFLAAMLRRADGSMRGLIEMAKQEASQQLADEATRQRDQFEQQVTAEVGRRTQKLEKVARNLAEFEEAFGEGLAERWVADLKPLGQAAKLLADCYEGKYSGVLGHIKQLRQAADAIEAVQGLFPAGEEQ